MHAVYIYRERGPEAQMNNPHNPHNPDNPDNRFIQDPEDEMMASQCCYYSQHYSSEATTLFYLIRVEPFTAQAVRLLTNTQILSTGASGAIQGVAVALI